MKNRFSRLPDAELEVMKAVWYSEAPVSTTKIHERLEQNRPWNVSALQTLLNRLIGRGFLSSGKEGKNRVYIPLVREKDYLASENRSFLERLNGNSVRRFVASLYDSHSLTEQDLEELKAFLDEKTKGGG